ncbi:MAG: hypothetical protein KDB14_33060 [Planctomycetales bacterium]|nr:hypothetical protein [Planctomycetales bacterium]
MRVCETQAEFEQVLSQLKLTPCPHCKQVGRLIRHGFLRGYDDQHPRRKTVRAQRVFCSNRNRAGGCGRTFSVWWADKVARLFLTAESLWTFLVNSVATGNKRQAFRELNSGLSESAPYRIWKRFREAQSAIRTALAGLCEPPKLASQQAAEHTLAHLKAAFGDHFCPPVAFQVRLQARFM